MQWDLSGGTFANAAFKETGLYEVVMCILVGSGLASSFPSRDKLLVVSHLLRFGVQHNCSWAMLLHVCVWPASGPCIAKKSHFVLH